MCTYMYIMCKYKYTLCRSVKVKLLFNGTYERKEVGGGGVCEFRTVFAFGDGGVGEFRTVLAFGKKYKSTYIYLNNKNRYDFFPFNPQFFFNQNFFFVVIPKVVSTPNSIFKVEICS